MPTTSRFRPVLVLALFAACGGDDDPAQGEDDSSTNASADDGVCTPGYEGCACAMDTCLAGLQCFSGLCVDAGPLETTNGEDTTPAEESSEDDESTSAPLTVGEESTTSSDEESTTTAVESSSEESTTTEPEPECLEGDNYCAEGEFQTCVEGQWQYSTCQEYCEPLGYDSPGCASTDGCTCEGFIDQPCADGSLGLCYCAEVDFAIPCTTEQWTEFYDQCIAEVDYAVCFIDYPWTGDPADIDCAAAEAACL